MTLDTTIRAGVSPRVYATMFHNRIREAVVPTRTCPHEGCDKPADKINGHYFVGPRRVRVWVCSDHKVGSSIKTLPTPPDIQAALDAEEAHLNKMNRWLRVDVTSDRGVSVKTLAPAGHGNPIRGDRVKAWRWGA